MLSAILRKRDERPFASVADLYRRTPVWRAALENLIGAGFLYRLRPRRDRAALLGETSDLCRARRSIRLAGTLNVQQPE